MEEKVFIGLKVRYVFAARLPKIAKILEQFGGGQVSDVSAEYRELRTKQVRTPLVNARNRLAA